MPATSDFYLARAAESARDAREAKLPNVRERCLRSEAAWREMANRMLKHEADRERQAAEKAALAEQDIEQPVVRPH
jgi:hypothetical protein